MSTPVPTPWAESRPLPPYRALLAVDAKDFTGLPSLLHPSVGQVIPELVDQALDRAGLSGLKDGKRFPASTGDGIVFGFDPTRLPFIVWPFLRDLDAVLARYNGQGIGPRIRLRASVHVGPLPDSGRPGDGNGTARNDTHRLLDSRPVKAVLVAGERATHLAAVLSERVYEDVVLAGHAGIDPDFFIEVPATVEGKAFAQRAWLYIPSPSGRLLSEGVLFRGGTPEDKPSAESADPADPAGSAPRGADRGGSRTAHHSRRSSQHVGEGMAVTGDVGGSLTYTGTSTTHHGTNQHWGSGDNIAGDKRAGSRKDER